MSEETLYDYTLSPLTVYITKDPNNESIATLTMGVNNATHKVIKCDWLALIIKIGEGASDLTSQPGRIVPSSGSPDKWTFTRVEGAAGNFRAEPIFPVTGLNKGESISLKLSNIAVNGVLGSTKVEIIEMTRGRRKGDERFLNKDLSDLRIDYFRAVPNSIKPDENATLQWKTNASECTLTRAGDEPKDVVATGSKQVRPADSANYTLNAYGGGQQVQANAFVSVIRVKILEFAGPTDRIPPGSKTPLLWRTEFATRCELKANGIMVDPQAPVQADPDPYWVSPQRDPTIYVLLAHGKEGRPYQRQLTVFLQPKFTLSLRETWTEPVPHRPVYITMSAPSLNDTRLFAASPSAQLHVLDWQARKRIFSRNSLFFYFLEPSLDGTRLFAGTFQLVVMLDATPGSNFRQIKGRRFSESVQPGAAFHPDGSKVYFACGTPRYHSVYEPSGLTTADESEPVETDSSSQTELRGFVCLSTDDLSIQFTLPVGTNPGGISISPDGNTLCLVEMNSALLYLIDLATSEISTISIGSFSETRIVNSVWSPDGTKIYATNCTPGTIWVVTAATQAVSKIDLGADVTPALLRLGPAIPGFEAGSNVLYALCGKDGTVAGISTATDQVLSRVSLGQLSNPAFAFAPRPHLLSPPPTMVVAPDGKSIFVSNPKNSIFVIDNGAQHLQTETATREGVELDGTVF